jgi:hypothetical protein
MRACSRPNGRRSLRTTQPHRAASKRGHDGQAAGAARRRARSGSLRTRRPLARRPADAALRQSSLAPGGRPRLRGRRHGGHLRAQVPGLLSASSCPVGRTSKSTSQPSPPRRAGPPPAAAPADVDVRARALPRSLPRQRELSPSGPSPAADGAHSVVRLGVASGLTLGRWAARSPRRRLASGPSYLNRKIEPAPF